MPARDGTGPFGTGPVGRRLGPCGGNVQDYDPNFGMGMANRWGRRFGNWRPRWGWNAGANGAPAESELQYLQNRQNRLQEQLEMISRRIDDLNKAQD